MSTNPLSSNTSRGLAVNPNRTTNPRYEHRETAATATASASIVDVAAKLAELRAKLEALLKPSEWVMKTGSGAVTSKTVYKLCNIQSGECLGWKPQPYGTGINLAWFEQSADKQARLVKKDGGTVRYGDTVALFVGKTADSYLHYKSRVFGINLDWSTNPYYQWRIDSPAAGNKNGQALLVDDPFVLFNLHVNDTLVRCARSKSAFQGAWLKWGKTCSKAELAYTNKSLYEQLMREIRALGGY